MANQLTEMLKGTLEGIVLTTLAHQPAYGYEITAQLREHGFIDLAEGTLYALLVRIEQRGLVDVTRVPSEKGPPRKVYSLNPQGRAQLDEFWTIWTFLAERIDALKYQTPSKTKVRNDMAAKWFEALTGSLEQKKQFKRDTARINDLPEPYATAATAMHRYLLHAGGVVDGDTLTTMVTELADLWERAAVDGTPVRDIVGDDSVEFAETFASAYLGKRWIDKERARLRKSIEDATEQQSAEQRDA